MSVFSDSDIKGSRRQELQDALEEADVFFGSLLFDYDDVEWVKALIGHVPVRFVFESALEVWPSSHQLSSTFTDHQYCLQYSIMNPKNTPEGCEAIDSTKQFYWASLHIREHQRLHIIPAK